MFSLKSKIAVIGAGKVSYSLVNALKNSGADVSLIISMKLSSAERLAQKFGVKNFSDDLNSLPTDCKIFFLSVPDNRIKKTAEKISELNLDFENSLFIHLSGAEDVSVLNILKKKKAHTVSFHIMQSFPSKEIIDLTGCCAAIETGSSAAEKFLFSLAKMMKLRPFKLSSDDKISYHLAGVYASNFLVGNIFSAENVFQKRSRRRQRSLAKGGQAKKKLHFFEIVEPIIKTTLTNIKKNNAVSALSGPVDRGDHQTIRRHISSLKKGKYLYDKKLNLQLLNYISQSFILLKAAAKKYSSLNDGQIKIEKILQEELKKLADHL